ncbi:MAG: EAL domain-containing protein [Acidimicrobiia bacterium]|nr:EAL domain-containing protein [Acidimicrobiia bacterium]
MSLLRRFAPLLVSVAVVAALGAVGLLASQGANAKAEAMHRRDRATLQTTLAGLGRQYALFAFKEESDFASTAPWSLQPGDKADLARLQSYVSRSAILNYGAALVSLNKTPINFYAADPAGLPPASDAGYTPLVQGLLAGRPGLSSVMHAGAIPVVGFGVPVMVDGQPKAVLVAFFRADKTALQTYVSQLHYGRTGKPLLVDSGGGIVASGNPSLIGQRIENPEILHAVDTQRAGFLETTLNGKKVALSHAPLGIGGWTSMTEQTVSEFYGPLQSGRTLIDLTLVGVLAVAALALAVFSHTRHTAVKREKDTLRRSEERFQSLARNAFEIITLVDAEGTILYDSAAIERVLGFHPEERVGQNGFDFVHPDDQHRARDILERVLEEPGVPAQLEVREMRRDGEWRWIEIGVTNLLDDPSVGAIVANQRDITERRAFQEQLTRQAYHDALTGLPNRAMFQNRLEVALARAARRQRKIAVLFVDLDRFKIINDSLGHEVGDDLLVTIAHRLRNAVRDEDTVGRLSGDEFTVLLEEVENDFEAAMVAQRIIDDVRQPVDLGGHQVFVGASVGIAVSQGGEDRAEDLLRDADLAMYRAKERGRSRYEVFEMGMGARARLRLDLETDLRRALDNNELVLHYQPEVSLRSGRIIGAEALVRWEHPTRGLLMPDQFIALAEESGQIVPLGLYVMEKASVQAADWQKRFGIGAPTRVSVNVSGRQLPTLVGDVTRMLGRSGLDPRALVLEITESVVMEDPESAISAFEALRQMGVSLAIDDFGTGYSSLSWLKHFPISTLKLDKSFVQGLGVDPADRAIAQSVLTMAACLDVAVTAEGIETAEQAAELIALGCISGQGYYYARPEPPDEMERLIGESVLLGRVS